METTGTIVSENDMQQKEGSSEEAVQLSIVIPVSGRWGDLRDIYEQHAKEISATGYSCEFIFVLDGPDDRALQALRALKLEHPEILVIALNRWFGEATTLATSVTSAPSGHSKKLRPNEQALSAISKYTTSLSLSSGIAAIRSRVKSPCGSMSAMPLLLRI